FWDFILVILGRPYRDWFPGFPQPSSTTLPGSAVLFKANLDECG
ncbi:MAG: hypothetical protein QOH35_2763, partial [Acidobacteriaceae bacterium]|nr:hypothetical protein [Acidobacteriaceae bacterium]